MAFNETERTNCPEYQNYRSRLATFETWDMLNLCQSAESMAHAGFFRLNDYDDHVQCFCCMVKLYAWQPSDTAFVEHKRWSPVCPYVRELKCQTVLLIYILPLITMVERHMALRKDPQKCEQCQIDDISIAFWPCGHRLTCSVCALPLLRCPRCHVHILQKKSINQT